LVTDVITTTSEHDLVTAIMAACATKAQTEDKAMTTQEIVDLTGISTLRARVAIRKMLAAGKIRCVYTWRNNIAGVAQKLPGWVAIE
jgi:hypothetical protein